MSDRAAVCREILEHVARVHRLRAIREELRAMEQFGLASGINRGIRLEHWSINRLQQQLGLSSLLLVADAAAFARAQLGLPIDAPVSAPKPRRQSSATWQRDLAAGAAVA